LPKVGDKERLRRWQTGLEIVGVGVAALDDELAVLFPAEELPLLLLELELLLPGFEFEVEFESPVLLVPPPRWNVVRDARPTELGSVQRLGLLEITFRNA
jgi:hypothetical protein